MKFITKDFIDDGSGLFYKGIALSLAAAYPNADFVSTSGNNATATRGRMDRPFKTIQAAVNATWRNVYDNHVIIVLGGKWDENVTVPYSSGGFTLWFQNVTLSGGNGTALSFAGQQPVTVLLENSRIVSYGSATTVALNERCKLIGRGRAEVVNQGTGSALTTYRNLLANLFITNNGDASNPLSYPALVGYDSVGRYLDVKSTNSPALNYTKVTTENCSYQDCSFSSQNSYGVRSTNQSRTYFRNCQVRSMTLAGMAGGAPMLDYCNVFSEAGPAIDVTGAIVETLFRNTIFKGATHAIYSSAFYVNNGNPPDRYFMLEGCQLYAGTGNPLDLTWNNTEAAVSAINPVKRILIRNCLYNKVQNYNSSGYYNPQFPVMESDVVTLLGAVCPVEWTDGNTWQ
jgi:hypothetical protein